MLLLWRFRLYLNKHYLLLVRCPLPHVSRLHRLSAHCIVECLRVIVLVVCCPVGTLTVT